jgi:hypothetical protein
MSGFLSNIPIIGGLLDQRNANRQNAKDRERSKKNLEAQINWEREAADTAWDRNVDMWNMTNQWNLDQWNRENTYNTPYAQMQRFKDAGLNPHLIYGQGSAGNAGSVSASTPAPYKIGSPDFSKRRGKHVPQTNLGNTLAQYLSFKKGQAELDRIDAETSLIKERAANESVRNTILSEEGANANIYFNNRAGKMAHDQVKSNWQALAARGDASQKAELEKYSSEFAIESLKKARLENQNLVARTKLSDAQLLGQSIKNEWDRIGFSPSSSYQAKMAYRELLNSGFDEHTSAQALLAAGVASDLLKSVVPAGVLGRALKTRPKQIRGKSTHRSGDDTYTDYHYE